MSEAEIRKLPGRRVPPPLAVHPLRSGSSAARSARRKPAMAPPHVEDDPSTRTPLIAAPPSLPRRAAAWLHPLPLLVAAALATYYHLLAAPAPSYYHALFLSLGSNDTAAAHLRALTARPHLAGTEANAAAAEHVASTLASLSFPTRLTPYSVLLSYPSHRSLSLSAPGRAATAFPLVQDTYPDDPNAALSAEVVPTFLAYSASGSAAAEAVYANYGRAEDYAHLAARGVNVTGKVAVARYGKVYRGDKVINARRAGAAAAVIYTDFKDYAPGKAFPDGPWMPPSGVQVGSTFKGVGDPTTPMWPSSEGCERLSIAEAMATEDMPGIPVLPVSGRDGEEILQLIGGDVAPEDWQGGEGAPVYRLGPGPAVLNLTYTGNETMATIQNVIAVIEGKEEPDRYVILGNHRDAWTFGAADPNSGTAALLELAQRLSKLQNKGWRPRRTIILCNWDAEEYGLIGSTEWVEENRAMLTSKTVAYLNVDIGVCNSGFEASATPQLDELLKQASKQVPNPDNGTESLYDMWMASDSSLIGRLGGGSSDYSAFVQHIGIPSVDMSIGSDYAVYHSLYDDFTWMEKYGDPMFRRHVAVASMWGLLALRLSDEEILPFNYSSYVAELEKGAVGINERVLGMPVSLSPLHKSIKEFDRAVLKVNSELEVLQTRKFWSPWGNNPLKVRDLNDRLMMTERAFTEREGLSGRPWYKHMIYGPSLYNDYGAEVYPGVDDAIQTAKKTNTSESWQSVQHEVHRIARIISQAALVIRGELT
ncbi:probable glutamate carboxypeptidase LAMP1 [Lolium rigidum]|uniref:probable glutamate carboxypeptidase LAMP1 n=1 Tax=Lolium rigidum TaxID=89674 RepID=UPI001F5D8159|nr:probable glutamate carboxypeptidase LAMP1 [Lolium rigidum]